MHTTYIHDDERVEWSEYVKVFCFHQHHRQTKQLVECRAMFSTSATNDTSLPLPQTYVIQTCWWHERQRYEDMKRKWNGNFFIMFMTLTLLCSYTRSYSSMGWWKKLNRWNSQKKTKNTKYWGRVKHALTVLIDSIYMMWETFSWSKNQLYENLCV